MNEFKVGDVVEDNGVKYRAIKSNGACAGCCHEIDEECKKDVSVFGRCLTRCGIYCGYIKWETVK